MRWWSISWPGFLSRPIGREVRSSGRASSRAASRNYGARVGLMMGGAGFALLVIFQLLFPLIPRVDSAFPGVGEIAEREVRAPFAFSAPLLERDVEMRRLQKVLVEPPAVKRLPGEQNRVMARFNDWRTAFMMHSALVEVSAEERAELLTMRFPELAAVDLDAAFELADPAGFCDAVQTTLAGIMSTGVVDNLPPGNYEKVLVISGASEITVDVESLTLQGELPQRLTGNLRDRGLPAETAGWAGSLARVFVKPNLIFSPEETQARRDRSRLLVPSEREFIKGERIVGRGDRVTEQEAGFLGILHQELIARGSIGAAGTLFWRNLARLLLAAGALLLFAWIGWLHFREIFTSLRSLIAVTITFAVFLLAASFALDQPSLGPFAVPLPLLAILVTVLFKGRVGYPMTGLAVALLAIVPGVAPSWLLAWLFSGLVSVTMVRRIRQRDQFYKAIAVLVVLQVFLILIVRLATGTAAVSAGNEYFAGVLSPIASVALALFLLPVIEPLVGVSSDLTLLELSDLNHPLLKRMALESQGTFHHCQVVAQLAENAARSIGANSLLTRVGSLFHDIGKMNKPEYYVENQAGGRNRHDELSPNMSALVVASHVKDGIEMGVKWRLPQAVIDFIPEHHGTSVMKYFYHKALESAENETVKVDDFRYPGPRPQSRETAILMLADAVEASTRSLTKPTPGRIREMTKQVVDDRMLSGELDECQLTLSDLARIRESFIPLLTGIHHARITYPGQREGSPAAESKGDS